MRPLTRSYFLILLLERFPLLASFLLETCFSSLWSPPFFFHTSSLISLCRQGAALAHLDPFPPHNVVKWTDGSAPFPLAKVALAYLPIAHFVASRPRFSFRQALFPQRLATFCKLFVGLGSTNKSAIFLFLSDSRYPVHSCFSFYLKLSGRNRLLSPLLSGYNGSPNTYFSRKTSRLISWPDRKLCSYPLQSLIVALLLTLLSTFIFSRTGSVLSHLNSWEHRLPQLPLRNLWSLVKLTVPSLVFAAKDTAFC